MKTTTSSLLLLIYAKLLAIKYLKKHAAAAAAGSSESFKNSQNITKLYLTPNAQFGPPLVVVVAVTLVDFCEIFIIIAGVVVAILVV